MNSSQERALESVNNQVQTLKQALLNVNAAPRPQFSRGFNKPVFSGNIGMYNPNGGAYMPQGGTGGMGMLGYDRRFGGCSFCGGNDRHFMSSCLVREEYMNRGIIKRNKNNNRLVMQNGDKIPTYPLNTPIKSRIDAHIK